MAYTWGESLPPPFLPSRALSTRSSADEGGKTCCANELRGFDVIVGSDLVYDAGKEGFDWQRNHDALVVSFNVLAHASTTILLAIERRRHSQYFREPFLRTLTAHGWHCSDMRPFSIPGCTDMLIVTLRRRTAVTPPASVDG